MEGTIILTLLGTMMISLCKQNVETCFIHIQAKIRTKIVHFWWTCFVHIQAKIQTKLSTFGGHALFTSKQMRTKLSMKLRDNIGMGCVLTTIMWTLDVNHGSP
ncbi:hypothetical protein RclHR1_32800001 [Rhizophagus clarus]|uniref:Uncharacterized protein n=1 Tax=Rhizophagus clarus TaxID=94130 RepID=A0A2Z6R986_9GLOM|nr:hypothetical protein RclHR1_32800001 [Rhizophagus clarus]GES80821.1 hypothetical protein RCL_e14753_RclHR1_32800001 [Rhizophagus clarus]